MTRVFDELGFGETGFGEMGHNPLSCLFTYFTEPSKQVSMFTILRRVKLVAATESSLRSANSS